LVEQHRGGDAADRELGGAIEKSAAVDPPVNIGVEQDEQFLVEVVRGLALHRSLSGRWGRVRRLTTGAAR
jgi:hypothetical protein